MKSERAIATACQLFAHASSTLLVNCSSGPCRFSVNAVCFPDDLSMTPSRCRPHERQGSSGQTSLGIATAERPFCTLARYTLRRRTASFTCMCLSTQVNGRETRVHADRWHAGYSLRSSSCCSRLPPCLPATSIFS
jgi:hypothetical protein